VLAQRGTRRELLKAGGLLAAVGASGATRALAQVEAAPPLQTAVTPKYFPLGEFAPEVSLAGKVAVITGASRGLGLATGLALQAEGVTVIGTSRVPAYYPRHPFPMLTLDVADLASVEAFASELAGTLNGQPIDILINNAGRGVFGTAVPVATSLVPYMESQTQLAMETLYIGQMRVTNRLLPMMSQSSYSRLLYTVSTIDYSVGGSEAGEAAGGSFFSTYVAGKRALLTYANNLRGFLRVSGSPIKVSTINPTLMKTGFSSGHNPIYLEPVDPQGNSQNPYLQAVLDGFRALMDVALPASFVG